jgi:hypothetical protein
VDLSTYPKAGENSAFLEAKLLDGAHMLQDTEGIARCTIYRRKNNGTIINKSSNDVGENAADTFIADEGSFWPYRIDKSIHHFEVTISDVEYVDITITNGTCE